MKIRDIEISVIKADITELAVDAIVNAANNELVMGGGLAGVIKKKGGVEIEAEAVKLGPIRVGEAVATGAGKLKARHVIHAATMALDHKTDEHLIRAACRNAIGCAVSLGLRSIAIPALGCGVGRFPVVGCAKIVSQEVLRAAREAKKDAPLREIVICLNDDDTFTVFEKQVYGYLRHVTEDLAWGPYICTDIIIEINNGIVIIERTNPPFGWALPGGFVDRGESLETAARREAKEETDLDLEDVRQFHTYSDPSRDPRFHTVTTMFTAKGVGTPKAGDDAKGLKVVPFGELRRLKYAFDHNQVIEDYLRSRGM
jgi:O-acetyl-ADP-ribose deacetylase (regulator of RNase III)/ADP-ribose pyrophosphatase YjhB (NUDIX family)